MRNPSLRQQRALPYDGGQPRRRRNGKVTAGGQELRLTPKEFDLLRYLILHPNRAIPHRELLQAVWGPDYGDEVEYLRVFIKQLRRKIERKPEEPAFILTEPWVGYRLNLPAS